MQKEVKLLDYQLTQNRFIRIPDPISKPSNSFFRALSISIFGNHGQVDYIKSMMKLTLLSNIQKNTKKKYKDNPFPIISQNSLLLKKFDTPDKMMFWEYWENCDRQCFQKDNYELASFTFNKKISIFSISQDSYLNQLMVSSCRKRTGQKIYMAKIGKKYFSVQKQANVSMSGFIRQYFLKNIISKIVDEERSLDQIKNQRDILYPSYDEVMMNSHKKFQTRAHKKSLSQCGDIINKLQQHELDELEEKYSQQIDLAVNSALNKNKFDSIQNRSQKNQSSRKNLKKKNEIEIDIDIEIGIAISPEKTKNQTQSQVNQVNIQELKKSKSVKMKSSQNCSSKNNSQNKSKNRFDLGNQSIEKAESQIQGSFRDSLSKQSPKSKALKGQNQENQLVNSVTFNEKITVIQDQNEKEKQFQNQSILYEQPPTEHEVDHNNLNLQQTGSIQINQNEVVQPINTYGYTPEQYAMYQQYSMQMGMNMQQPGMNMQQMQPNMQIPHYYQSQEYYLQQMQAMYPNYYHPMYQEQYYAQPQQLVPNSRYRGRLKFFQANNKYGFIVVDTVNIDLFVHYDDLSKAGITKDKLQSQNNRQMRFQFTYYEYDGKHKKSKKAIDLTLLSQG